MLAENKRYPSHETIGTFTNPFDQMFDAVYKAAEDNNSKQLARYNSENHFKEMRQLGREFVKVREWNNIPAVFPIREADFHCMDWNAPVSQRQNPRYAPDVNGMIHFSVLSEIPQELRKSYPSDNPNPTREFVESVLKGLNVIQRNETLDTLIRILKAKTIHKPPFLGKIEPVYYADIFERDNHTIAANLKTAIPGLLLYVNFQGQQIGIQGLMPVQDVEKIITMPRLRM